MEYSHFISELKNKLNIVFGLPVLQHNDTIDKNQEQTCHLYFVLKNVKTHRKIEKLTGKSFLVYYCEGYVQVKMDSPCLKGIGFLTLSREKSLYSNNLEGLVLSANENVIGNFLQMNFYFTSKEYNYENENNEIKDILVDTIIHA